MAFGTFLSLICVAIGLGYFWIRRRYAYFDDNGIVSEKPTFPFGNLKGVGKEFHVVYKIRELYEKFKGKAPLFGIHFFAVQNVVITDLELVKNILVRDFDTFHNRGVYYNAKDDPLTAHLFTIEDDHWRNMRAKLTPTFTSGKMKLMFDTLVEISNLMVNQLRDSADLENIEMKNKLANFTTDVIGNIAFGLELNSIKDPDAEFRRMGKKIFLQDTNLQFKILFLASFRSLGRKLGMRLLPTDVSDFFLKTLRETIDYRLENNIERNDVVDLLLKVNKDSKGGEDGKLTFHELAAQCFVFFIAGFETSSSTSSFVLYALSLNQDIQEKVRDEIKSVLAKSDGKITYEGMLEMKYLQMVIDETLRMYGPVFGLLRTATKDYKVPDSDLMIRKGQLAIIPIYSIHMDANIYPKPEKFDPERFTEENKRNRHPMAHLPFGDGPRNCIGLRFGLMQTKIALSNLLMNFKFSPSSRTSVPMKFDKTSILLAPYDDMWLKVEKL